jgi:ferrous iron transport protein B
LFPDGRPERVIALIGNPNVGKSTLFNHLTGQDAFTAHYPGKTPDVNVGTTKVDGDEVSIVDIPGVYALGGTAEEQWVARRVLLDLHPEAVAVVLDSTNLTRNLVLALQVLDLGLPTLLVLNLSDEARRGGITIDAELLSALVGVPVVETVARTGVGVADFVRTAARLELACSLPHHRYSDTFEHSLRPLAGAVTAVGAAPSGLAPRSVALQLIEGRRGIERTLTAAGQTGLLRVAEEARRALMSSAKEPPETVLSRERHGAAGVIADRCVTLSQNVRPRAHDVVLRLSTRAITGLPLLAAMLLSIFGFLFFVGGALAEAFSAAWVAFASPVIRSVVYAVAGQGAVAESLLWGLDSGLEAALGIGLPYILTFYFLLALIEDSGYLNAVAFLSDRVMHRLGLHGRAIIPLVAGAGCSVPAVLSVRVLPTERERFIAATLVSMVPCSARTAVLLGAVGAYLGWLPAMAAYVVTFVVTFTVGLILNRFVPGRGGGMVMEMFPFRRPDVRVVARKAWTQFQEFLVVATPLVVIGSIVLGGLYESGWLLRLSEPLSPLFVDWLRLPAFTGLVLLFGLLRKEFALQLLVTLAIATTGTQGGDLTVFLSASQIFVYALVNTLAMPCISTVAVLGRVIGWKRAILVLLLTVGVAVFVGGILARIIPVIFVSS